MPAMVNKKTKPQSSALSVDFSSFYFYTDTLKGVFFPKYS